MDSTSTTDAPPTVSSVDGKLPPFWTADPALWFIQVESQFTVRRITTDLTKYHYVVSSLPPAISSEIRDLLLAPPVENAYATLKETLIRRVTPSEPQRLQQLLRGTELGDRTPSQLLRHMQQLLGGTSNTIGWSTAPRTFLQKLPSGVRMVIAASEHKDLTAAAELADKLVAMTPPTPMAAVQAQQPLNELQEMREEIARLAETVSALHASGRAQTITEPNTPLSQEQHEHICWYHRRIKARYPGVHLHATNTYGRRQSKEKHMGDRSSASPKCQVWFQEVGEEARRRVNDRQIDAIISYYTRTPRTALNLV
ncbi:hypothetical protein MRX96_049335 [Rhipicephalus microplus]